MSNVAYDGAVVVNHPLMQLTAGDSWQFDAALTDADGNPLDLTNATVTWALLNFNSKPMIQPTDYTVQVGTNPGECSILVAGNVSTNLASGSYTDFLRVTDASGAVTTLIQGPMRIKGDPFATPHTWDLKGINVTTGIKPNDILQAMQQRYQVQAVYNFTNGGSANG
jgi:hypothetical protein